MFKLSDLKIPLLQAPMVGVSTPALAAAVSNAGGLGGIAIGAMTPEGVPELAADTRALTPRPFNINIFVVREATVDDAALQLALRHLRRWREKFGLAPYPVIPGDWTASFPQQLDALIEARPAVASFTFGCLTGDEIERLHRAGIFVIGTATTPEEVAQCDAADVDAICIQGLEAGGHRGSFTPEAQLQGTLMRDLLRDAVALTRKPVIAAGGIMTGADIRMAVNAGAAAAQLGTAFLLAPEAATNAPWRARLRQATGAETQLTRVFSGRYARGLRNAFMDDMADIEARLPAYPIQNVLTTELRAAAAAAGDADCLSLWGGAALEPIRALPAAEIVALLAAEIQAS